MPNARRKRWSLLLTLACAASLSGCAAPQPKPPLSPEPRVSTKELPPLDAELMKNPMHDALTFAAKVESWLRREADSLIPWHLRSSACKEKPASCT